MYTIPESGQVLDFRSHSPNYRSLCLLSISLSEILLTLEIYMTTNPALERNT